MVCTGMVQGLAKPGPAPRLPQAHPHQPRGTLEVFRTERLLFGPMALGSHMHTAHPAPCSPPTLGSHPFCPTQPPLIHAYTPWCSLGGQGTPGSHHRGRAWVVDRVAATPTPRAKWLFSVLQPLPPALGEPCAGAGGGSGWSQGEEDLGDWGVE